MHTTNVTNFIKLSLTLLLCFIITLGHAHTITETQKNIHQLDSQIKQLKQNLSQTHDKQTQLKEALLKTEQDIKRNVVKLSAIQTQLAGKQKEIANIELNIAKLKETFHTLQAQLSKHLQARYKQSENQPLAWLFINAKQHSSDKLLTYYQFLIRANQKTIDQLKITEATLTAQQQHLREEMAALNQIQTQWQAEQLKLALLKKQHTTLLSKLNNHIETQEKNLTTAQINRNHLSQILRTLNQQSVIQTRHPMTRMKSKLPLPIVTSADHIRKLNQGIILYSTEGSPVHAVFPGKVVFAEWLNGYGLLMIIDHGWGLMTLYANNLALMRQKGDTVTQGQQIATVGHSGTEKESGLYFEVRKRGKAIPPLEWLGVRK